MKRAVQVVPYDEQWPEAFAREQGRLAALLGPAAAAIHHIGSTGTLKCTMITSTYGMRPVTVGTKKKSIAAMSLTWFSRKERQIWEGGPLRGGR